MAVTLIAVATDSNGKEERIEAFNSKKNELKQSHRQMQSIHSHIISMVSAHLRSQDYAGKIQDSTKTTEADGYIGQYTRIDKNIDGIEYTLIISTSRFDDLNFHTTLSINKIGSIPGPAFTIPIYSTDQRKVIPVLLSNNFNGPPARLKRIIASLINAIVSKNSTRSLQ